MAVLDLVEANMVDLAVALPATNGKLLAWLETTWAVDRQNGCWRKDPLSGAPLSCCWRLTG